MSAPLGSGFLFLSAITAWSGGKSGETAGEAQPPVAAPEHVLQVRARELWTAEGKRIENGLLIVVDGRIRSVGSERELDPRLPLLQHDGVVTAGLIACQTGSGAAGELLDDTRSVMPGARTSLAFDPAHSDFGRALAAGITSMVLAPGGENLVGGLSSVVKTAGGRVLDAEATLALSFSSSALGRSSAQIGFQLGAAQGDGSELDLLAEPDGRPETTSRSTRGTREPTSYAGAVALLRKLFTRGDEPFGRARKGELLVTIEAWNRHEVLRAAQFAQEYGLHGAIRGAPLSGDPDVLAAIHASGLGVILGPFSDDQSLRSLESVRSLGAAGVPVGFALDAPEHAPEDLRLFAARALWAGAPRDVVWKALTSDAARLSGVDGSIGVLAPDHDADFVLWSGDPLDLTSRVVAVYVDGARSWPAPAARATR